MTVEESAEDRLNIMAIPGIRWREQDDEPAQRTVVPNFLPPANNISPKTLPPMRMLEGGEDITKMLKTMLENAPLSVKQIADAMERRPQTIYNLRRGAKGLSLRFFLKLCHICGARLYLALPRK